MSLSRKEGLVVAAHGGLGIALAAGDGAEAVEPPGNGGDEAPLALHIGGDGPEQRRRGLVRAVGAPEALDRLVGAPARLQQVVDPAFGIGAGQIGVIAAPGAPGHGEHQDALVRASMKAAVSARLADAGRAAQRQTLAARIGNSQHPARAAGDFRDRLVPEMLHDLVERRRHRRERGELLDQRVAAGDRLLAEHGIAVTVEHRPREQVAALVGEGLLQLHREGVGQELDHGLARGEVDGEVVPFGGRDLGDAPFHQRLAGRDQLDHGRASRMRGRPRSRGSALGHFMAVSRWPKKRCLAPSNAESAADLAFRFSVSSPSTMPVAFRASSMFLWMILKAPA